MFICQCHLQFAELELVVCAEIRDEICAVGGAFFKLILFLIAVAQSRRTQSADVS